MHKHYCQYCSQELNPYNEGQKFCTPDCMSEYYKEHPDLMPTEENLERRAQELERRVRDLKRELKKQEEIYKKLRSELK